MLSSDLVQLQTLASCWHDEDADAGFSGDRSMDVSQLTLSIAALQLE